MRRRKVDLLEIAITQLLKKYIGSLFAGLLAKAISKFAKDLARQLFEKWIIDDPNETAEEDEMMFI